MAAAQYYDVVQKMYVGYFGRPADPAGLQYWAEKLSANGGDLTAITTGFGNSAEAKALWGSLDTQVAIDTLYQQLFNRSAEPAGLIYWTNKIASGAETLATIARALAEGAQNDDVTTLAKKVAVAARYTDVADDSTANILAYKGDAAAAAARAQLKNVTKDTDATTFDVAAIVTAVAAGSSSGITGSTYTLTTASDNVAGTGNNDVINGLVSSTASEVTLSGADIINGGAGTDKLNITVTGTATATTNGADITNVETISIRNVGSGAAAFDAGQAVGTTTVEHDRGTGTLAVTNMATGSAFSVVGNNSVTHGNSGFQYATATNAVTLNVSGGVKGGDIAVGTVGGAAAGTATTATVNATGTTANTVGVVDLANATLTNVTINAAANLTGNFLSQVTDQVAASGKVTISGAATLVTLTAALDNDIATIDASGLTAGGISATLGSLATQTVTGGAGSDIITTGAVLTTGSVNAGSGTDTLVLGTNVAHANTTALAAKYTNFEIIRVGASYDMSNFQSATGVELQAMNTQSITGLSATQAANVKVLGDQTGGVTLALAAGTASGTSDVLTMTMGTGLTTSNAFDLGNLTVTGFETVNLNANNGPTATAGANQTVTVGSLVGATLSKLNLTGSAFSITAADTTVGVTIDASALTGDDATTELGLTIGATTFATGSVVTGSAYKDSVTLDAGTEKVTFNAGAGNDNLTADAASLNANGTTDTIFNGGTGTDSITVSDTSATLTDTHFTNMSNVEALITSTGSTSITTGTAFNNAFASGATITTSTLTDASTYTFAGGLASTAINLTVTASSLVADSAGEDVTITTGSAADTVTVNATSWVGAAGGDSGSLTISTGAGNDTITFAYGDMLATTTSQNVTITAGTGADTITKGAASDNSTTATSVTHYVVAAGDSTTTAWDKITNFEVADGTNMSDGINFDGTAAVGTLSSSTDAGTILSHTITSGIAQFDDAATYASALVINSANLSDVVAYLVANTATNDVVAFTYDSDASGSVDGTMVFHNGTVDSLVFLSGLTTADAIITSNGTGANDLFVF